MKLDQVKELQMMLDVASNQLAELERSNKKLKQENERLSALLDNTVSKAKDQREEEFICINEINKLRQKTLTEPLTLEDVKKLETYHKILNNLAPKQDAVVQPTDKMSVDELLKTFEQVRK